MNSQNLSNYDNIPEELRLKKNWVVWNLKEEKDKDGNIKLRKPPLQIDGELAKPNDPKTWATFEDCRKAVEAGKFDGLGFVFDGSGYIGIDIDKINDMPEKEQDEAVSWVKKFKTYTEESPSGNGLHLILKGKKTGPVCKNGSWEMYEDTRYFTFTGDVVNDLKTILEVEKELIQEFYSQKIAPTIVEVESEGSSKSNYTPPTSQAPLELTDDQIIEIVRNSRNEDHKKKFQRLFDAGDTSEYNNDHSKADIALCGLLAYYTRDPAQLERLFSRSALAKRDKWKSREDYRSRTINKAIQGCPNSYSGKNLSKAKKVPKKPKAVAATEANELEGPQDWPEPEEPEEPEAAKEPEKLEEPEPEAVKEPEAAKIIPPPVFVNSKQPGKPLSKEAQKDVEAHLDKLEKEGKTRERAYLAFLFIDQSDEQACLDFIKTGVVPDSWQSNEREIGKATKANKQARNDNDDNDGDEGGEGESYHPEIRWAGSHYAVYPAIACNDFFASQNGNLIYYKTSFYRFNKVWEPIDDKIIRGEIKRMLCSVHERYSKKSRIEDILYQLQLTAIQAGDKDGNLFDKNKDLIAFENCVLNLVTGEKHKHRREDYQTIKLPFSYDHEAKHSLWSKFLSELELSEESLKRLQEWAGYCLMPDTRLEKCLYLKGEGCNGKSTFLETISAMLGSNAVSLEVHEIFDRFKTCNLENKLACFSTDISTKEVMNNSFKKIVSGEAVQAEKKNKDAYQFRPFARFLFSANSYLPTSDHSYGFFRRFDLVEFKANFNNKDKKKDTSLKYKLAKELPGVFNWALDGLRRLIAQDWNMTESAQFDEAKKRFSIESNPVEQFLESEYERVPEGREQSDNVRRAYVEWAKLNGYMPLSDIKLGREMTRLGVIHSRVMTAGSRGYYYLGIKKKCPFQNTTDIADAVKA